MDIEFIKWMCEKAGPYMVCNDVIYYEGCYFDSPESLWNDNLHKGNLLQRAFRFCIVNELSYMNFTELVRILGSDEETEKYLKYIYEQETK